MGKKKKNKVRILARAASVLLVICLAGFSYWYLSLKSPVLPDPPLKDLAAARNVDLGIHIVPQKIDTRVYPDIASSQFGFVVIDGGGSHFSEIHPSPNKYDFSGTDKMVEFAEKHNMPIQFHHLVWGDDYVLPNWLTRGKYSQTELREILHNHVTTIVSRYKGRISEYSAVNEAFTERRHIYGLRDWWADHLGGDDYIDDVFKWAHEMDPQAKLILNDFQNEVSNQYSDDMIKYLKAAKARGVPVDGVGMQMHINALYPRNKQDVIDSMKRFKDIDVPVYITEYDINTNSVKGSNDYKQQLEEQINKDIVGACIESKACVSFGVFGISSKNDFIKKITKTNSRAYMFDSRYRPRRAFYAFRQAWQEK